MMIETDRLCSPLHLDIETRRCAEICQESLPIQKKLGEILNLPTSFDCHVESWRD